MKALKIIGFILLGLFAVALAWVMTLPSGIQFSRHTFIDASPHAVFREVNSYRKFNQWSPWFKLDPETKYTYEGPASGVGSKMTWSSQNEQVGEGSQWIVESRPLQLVKSEMKFGDMSGRYYASFHIEPSDTGTKLTWGYEAEDMGLVEKVFGSFMEGMLGPVYEEGLKNLKEMLETDAQATINERNETNRPETVDSVAIEAPLEQ